MKIEKYTGPPWDVIRRLLKPEFVKAGITSCELGWKGCTDVFNLTFAHSLRRRFIKTNADMASVALICTSCHIQLDSLELKETENIVLDIIENRMRPVGSIKVPPKKKNDTKRKKKRVGASVKGSK